MAVRPQPPARLEAIFHLPACLGRVLVPEVSSHDHDPLQETNTALRSRRGWPKTSGHSLTRVRTRLRTFFIFWKSAKKTLHQAHPRLQKYQLERAKKRMDSDLAENIEGLHQECQRSAPQSAQKYVHQRKATLLNPVREENLEDRTPLTTTRNWNVNVLLQT